MPTKPTKTAESPQSSRPSQSNIAWLFCGLRMVQAMTLFPEEVSDNVCNQTRLAALDRLHFAVRELSMVEKGEDHRETVLLSLQQFLWANSGGTANSVDGLSDGHALMQRIRWQLDWICRQDPLACNFDWWTFGLKLGDGCDTSTTAIQSPPMQDASYGYPPQPNVEVHPRWRWGSLETVEALARKLGATLPTMTTNGAAITDEIWERFSGPGMENYWWWAYIEDFVISLRDQLAPALVKPSFHDGVLRVGETIVRRYSRHAGNQVALLNAFEAAGWTQRITSPFAANPTAQSATIRDLNASIIPPLIRFRGDRQRGVIWEFNGDHSIAK